MNENENVKAVEGLVADLTAPESDAVEEAEHNEIQVPEADKTPISISAENNQRRKWIIRALAAVLCVLLALAVWVCVMNSQDTKIVAVRAVVPNGMDYELVNAEVSVQGTVLALRELDEVVFVVPTTVPGGTYFVPSEMLELPEGVTLTEEWEGVLTLFEEKKS